MGPGGVTRNQKQIEDPSHLEDNAFSDAEPGDRRRNPRGKAHHVASLEGMILYNKCHVNVTSERSPSKICSDPSCMQLKLRVVYIIVGLIDQKTVRGCNVHFDCRYKGGYSFVFT
jgi:hypothetical protein